MTSIVISDKDRKEQDNNPREIPDRKDPEKNYPVKDPAPDSDSVPREDDPSERQDDF
jgi:hypothetical protein